MQGLSTRPATVADASAVAALQVAGWRAAYRDLLPAAVLEGLSVEERAGALSERLEAGLVSVLLAEQDGELLGFGSFGASRDDDAAAGVGEVYALYVHPGRWRTGIGRALHAAVLQALRAQRMVEATLWVLEGNEPAQRFYRQHGWQPDGASQADDVHGVHLRYRRLL